MDTFPGKSSGNFIFTPLLESFTDCNCFHFCDVSYFANNLPWMRKVLGICGQVGRSVVLAPKEWSSPGQNSDGLMNIEINVDTRIYNTFCEHLEFSSIC